MEALDPRVSFAELATWPEDGRRWELYEGEPVVVPAPNLRHQRTVQALADVLREYERRTGGCVVFAPFDIVLSEYDVLQPGLVFFGSAKRARLDPLQAAYMVPDLAIEVLSRSTEARDRGRKMALLARQGLPEYWLVDPATSTIELYARSAQRLLLMRGFESGEVVSSTTLPGLSFDLDRAFAA